MGFPLALLIALGVPAAAAQAAAPEQSASQPASQSAEGGPAAVVAQFHQALLASMKTGGSGSSGCAARSRGLAAAIDQDFDMPYLAERVLRKRWDGLDEAQRKRFTALFRELVVTTYAGNFSSYSGESFSAPSARPFGADMQLVKTELTPAKGDKVSFDYVLRQTPDGWRIVNIIADGVSNLALWATQYDHVFAEQGFDGLMKQLQGQVDKAKAAC